MKKSLKDLRIEIDQIDEQLLALISARAKCASEVTDCKAFRYWVNNGTFSKPSKKTRRAEMNSIPITVEMFTRKSIRFDVGLNIKSVEV